MKKSKLEENCWVSEEELQNWALLPDIFVAEEFERIKRHVDTCELCKVYCELVLAAEKAIEAHLKTETGHNWCQRLLNQIASVCSPDCPRQVARVRLEKLKDHKE